MAEGCCKAEPVDAFVFYSLLAAAFGAMWWQHARRVARLPTLASRFDEDSDVALHVSNHAASSRGQELLPIHVLFGLLQDERVAAAVADSGGVVEDIEDRILVALDGSEPAPEGDDGTNVIAWAAVMASAQSRMATCTDLWAGLMRQGLSAVELLERDGPSAAEVLFALVHGVAEKDVPLPDTESVEILLINDDISTQELVVEILREVFDLDDEAATARMLEAHTRGQSVISREVGAAARLQIAAARRHARQRGYPLWIRAVAA